MSGIIFLGEKSYTFYARTYGKITEIGWLVVGYLMSDPVLYI